MSQSVSRYDKLVDLINIIITILFALSFILVFENLTKALESNKTRSIMYACGIGEACVANDGQLEIEETEKEYNFNCKVLKQK